MPNRKQKALAKASNRKRAQISLQRKRSQAERKYWTVESGALADSESENNGNSMAGLNMPLEKPNHNGAEALNESLHSQDLAANGVSSPPKEPQLDDEVLMDGQDDESQESDPDDQEMRLADSPGTSTAKNPRRKRSGWFHHRYGVTTKKRKTINKPRIAATSDNVRKCRGCANLQCAKEWWQYEYELPLDQICCGLSLKQW